MPRGGVLGKRKVASLSSASGIWNLDDVAIERKVDRWPGSLFLVPVEYLIVGGGGGGGHGGSNTGAGGGGAGGFRTSTGTSGGGHPAESTLILSLGSYTITVGGGGAGATSSTANGQIGNYSVLYNILSTGGGGGGSESRHGFGGGSGGGGSRLKFGGLGTPNQGYAGGMGTENPYYPAGGGGGSGGLGGDFSGNVSGDGGIGTTNDITGSSVTYAMGAAGCGTTLYDAVNGTNPAGAGTPSTNSSGGNATANLGGGGGAGYAGGGNGGSGIVILKIPDTYTATFSSGVTANGNSGSNITPNTDVSGYKIYSITETSTTSETVTFS